jgi:hypothetical protein
VRHQHGPGGGQRGGRPGVGVDPTMVKAGNDTARVRV